MISVVVPVFNRPKMAERALQTVVGQVGLAPGDVEILLVDDASEPELTLPSNHPVVRIIRLNENGGPSAARNAGVRAARGQYIAFLDSDDIWLKDKLAGQIQYLREIERVHPHDMIALVCSFYYPNSLNARLEVRVPRPGRTTVDFASGCWFCPGSALLIKRSIFDVVGPFDHRLRRLEDLDWFIRFGRLGGQLHVDSVASTIIAPSNSARYETVSAACELIEEKFNPGSDLALPNAAWRRLRAYLALERGAALLLSGRRIEGAVQLLASLSYKPRLQSAVEVQSDRRGTVPASVLDLYQEMMEFSAQQGKK